MNEEPELYIETEIPPGMTCEAYRRQRASMPSASRWHRLRRRLTHRRAAR